MLYSIDAGKYVKSLPHKKDFDNWRKNILDDDYKKIVDAINQKIDASDVNTAGWMPGHDWTGTVYEPIYYACAKNKTLAGMFFGQIVFDILMNRTDNVWGFGKYEKDGMPIKSTTYFILNNPPEKK